MSIMSGLKSLINKKAAMRTAVGVAATVSAASIVNDSMGIMEASHTVEHHAKTINGHANLAARILEIDRNQLVNTNYLRLASTIDDYLTGKTDKLHIDPSMFGTADAITAESQPDLDPRAAEAAKNITDLIQSTIEDEKDDNVSETPTNVVDFTSMIKLAASEDASKILNPEKSHIEKSSNIAPPETNQPKEDLKKDVKEDSEIKSASEIEDLKKSVDNDLKKDTKVEDKKSDDTSGLVEALNESIDRSNSQEDVSKNDTVESSKVEDQLADQLTNEIDDSKMSQDHQNEIHGSIKLEITVEYGNHRRITEFAVIKETTGVRRSDGSIEWNPVEFTKDDLPKKFKNSDIWNRAELVNPEFKATYTPDKERSVIQDKLTMRSLESKKKESEVKSSSRKITLKSESGEVLQEINQDSNSETISIPREIGRFYTDVENVTYDDKDIEIIYKERYQEVSEIVDYNVKDIDEEDNVINEYRRSVSIVKQIDRSKNMILSTNEDQAVESLDQEDLDGYEKIDRIVDHSNRSIIRKFRKVASVDQVVESSSGKDSLQDLTAKKVKEVSDEKLTSIPTLSNRAEYSKYTSINDFDSDLLDQNVISDLVFELSNGSYSEQESDKTLRPSKYSTKLVELNNRFTDRMIERINDFRRSLGLKEVSKQPLTLAQERMYASHVIYNYLANDHSSSKINDLYKEELNVIRRESMQPVHSLKTASQYLTPEAVADSMFRSILNESTSYLTQDGGETGHLEQLIDPEVKTVYAGMFIGNYSKTEQRIEMLDKIVSAGSLNDYSISTTLQYYK